MFTGLVQALGTVRAATAVPAGVRLEVDLGGWSHRPAPGDSIAVSGCCLTVAGISPDGGSLAFDCIAETLKKTALGRLAAGSPVNLEHAALPTTLLGGHLVQGHVDATGEVLSVAREAEWRMRIGVPEGFAPWLVAQGSIAVDGVSLTLAAISPPGAERCWFEVCLIPVTLAKTTLGRLAPGSIVNLEADCLAKMVARQLSLATARPR
jgi:riboflavin synthase alpha subunit